MYFRNTTDSEAHLLVLPSCTEHCPLKDFIRITKDLISDNRDEECKLSSSTNQTEVILIVALTVCLVLLILLLIILYWHCNQKTRHHRVPSGSDELA
ncbi:lysosomal acid phosphatase-like [Heterodontus francisci]|uniref:lysosomal acid phosphatase-like n=1 Tax=Heterodontus francisci TaxID=7792 RepID=UPI00355B96BD